MTLPFGIDISSYQYSQDGTVKPDFAKMNSTCDFVAVRAGISWGYTDRWFAHSWANITVPRLAYHVVYPNEDAKRQMIHFTNIVQSQLQDPAEESHIAYVLDMELDHGAGKAKITDTLNKCIDTLNTLTGEYPIIYSRASWINAYLDVTQLPPVNWWLAQYRYALPYPQYTPEAVSPPTLPKNVSSWLMHQTGEKGNGSAVGVASYYVDTDRWNGTKEQLLAFFGLTEQPEPEPEPPDLGTPIGEGVVITSVGVRLHVRHAPAGTHMDWLDSGDYVKIYEVFGGVTKWYRIGIDRWVSAEWVRLITPQVPASITWRYYDALFSQRDVRWKDETLGTKSTIGAHGCLLTCCAMVCQSFGEVENPSSLNWLMTLNDGYFDGNLWLWDKLSKIYPDMKFETPVYKPTDDQIINALKDSCLPILHVDFDDTTPLEEMHWVLAIGYAGNDILITDPWTGTIENLHERYGNVLRYAIYRRIQ